MPRKTTKKPAATIKKAAGKVTTTTKQTTQRAKKAAPKAPAKRRVAPKQPRPKSINPLVLNDRQQQFVDEYLVDLNATQAARRAGYSASTAGSIGHELLKKPEIVAAIAEARKAQQERTQITADRVVIELGMIAFADPRELVQVKTGCCRNCWGEGFKYQRTVSEYNHDKEQWLDKGNDPMLFEEQGGIGFNPLKPPHPECPTCAGDGDARVVLSDTRNLSQQAKALYAGARVGKFGVEVLTHSKMEALEKLGKHLGIYEKDNQQKTDPLSALLHRIAGGNGNGLRTVQNDPEGGAPAGSEEGGSSAFLPRQEVDDDDDD